MKRLFKNSNFIFAILTFLNLYLFFKNIEPTFSKIKCNYQFLKGKSEIRDFYRYDCKHLKRIGGFEKFVKLVPHDLYRYNQSINLSRHITNRSVLISSRWRRQRIIYFTLNSNSNHYF